MRSKTAIALSVFAGTVHAMPLVLVTSDQQQQIEIEVGPVAGEVRVFGIDGIPSGQTYTGVSSIELTLGAAQDFAEFRVFATEVPPILVDTGRGNSDIKFIYDIPWSATPVVTEVLVIGRQGEDKVDFDLIGQAADVFEATWETALGGGNNETNATVFSPDATDRLAIDLFAGGRAGEDKLDAQVISGAGELAVSFGARTGTNKDSATLTIDEQLPGAAMVSLDLGLGGGMDTAEVVTVLRGGTADLVGHMTGGNGADSLKLLLEGDGSSFVGMNGGAGDDVIDAEYKGAVIGSPALRGGDGDDLLKLIADQPSLMSPVISGGAGFDEAIGFGRITGVEQLN